MEEKTNSDESKWDKRVIDNTNKGIKKLLYEKELKIKWRRELEHNPSVVTYFKAFRGTAMEDFLNHYLDKKYLYHTYGDMYKKMSDDKRNQWINKAHEQLNIILQKQLFDKQCLWRAEQITLDGIDIAADFEVWSADIFNCPFLEPITWVDIEMYQAYLLTENLDLQDLGNEFYEWQDYSEFKSGYSSSENHDYLDLPEWYAFHNSRTGNSSLLLMQDLRGKKEEFYINLYFKDLQPQIDAKDAEREKNRDNRPPLYSYEEDHIAYFINTFEDRDFQKKYRYYHEMTENHDNNSFQEQIDFIIDNEESIPIASHYNLIEAVKIAYNSYNMKKIAEHLPFAYEQYVLTNKMGLSMKSKTENYQQQIKEIHVTQILKGRELNGEPRNLDF